VQVYQKILKKKIIKINKKEKRIVIKTDKRKKSWRKVHRITCSLYADPHVHGFNKKYFEAQTVGDWILYKGRRLSVHYRGKSFGSWVGPIKFGVKIFKHKIYSVGFTFDKLRIDGRIRNVPNGVLKLKRGLIRRAGNKITFSTNNGEEVDFITYGSFFNAYVRSNTPKISGICSQQFKKSRFFRNPQKGRRVVFKKRPCPRRATFKRRCAVKGLKGRKLKFCVRDLCNGLSRKIERRILKDNKKKIE